MRHSIGLPAVDRRVTVGQYVAAVYFAKANPSATFKHGLNCWTPASGAEIVREFRRELNDRINRDMPRGRKWDCDYQSNLRRDARRVNDYAARRIVDPINRLSTPELQRRFNWRYTADGLEITLYNR